MTSIAVPGVADSGIVSEPSPHGKLQEKTLAAPEATGEAGVGACPITTATSFELVGAYTHTLAFDATVTDRQQSTVKFEQHNVV